jgi:hypothetical protein
MGKPPTVIDETDQPPDDRRQAPEHLVHMLMAVTRPRQGEPGGFDPHQSSRIAAARARQYANQIWAEAWHTGAAWGLARNSTTRFVFETTQDRDKALAKLALGT